ncbi:DivIVA domain protein [Desulfosporosinus orientis DSM 765]|uniref:DivIVA domain protein n=1 Tax=Desulfosporosinus orientis (strain ATCC 19365 / DSM 765 / NCIMB 8382 / VKM B-1628 / Singapore I) TaxID=768706 RepID=G7WHA9_DESOD|nr:DivIVA domain-containing protein [Desulfosporosinus orientis]AET70199.1 DivIVA domain protein [Desulfosporosinus orientis DSM 765]
MEMTPLDIRNRTFPKGFRGYQCEEVEKFLEEVSQQFELAYTENFELKEKTKELETEISHYRQIENTLQQTLVLAQQTAEEVKEAARQESALILREAEHEKSKKVSEAQKKWEEIEEEIQALARKRDLLRTQLKSFLLAHLDLETKQDTNEGIA